MIEVSKNRTWVPYVVPFGIYMAFLLVQSSEYLVWLYPVKTLTVAVALWTFRKHYVELRPGLSWLAVAVGLVAIVIWIGIDPWYPKLSELIHSFENWLNALFHYKPAVTTPPEPPFDPTTISPAAARWAFIGFRIFGAVVVVPVMEELFWRAFLIRWIEAEDFKSVPVGTFGWRSFLFTVALFGAEHDQWMAGLVCGALYNWLLYRTRSVWACVVAHAVSNAALAAWVLARGDWKFW
jgi:membrane protease YdiL (CAAX protease family)